MQEGLERSEWRACELAGMGRSIYRYRRRGPDDRALRERLRSWAVERRRFGYRRLTVMLGRKGWTVNHKRVYRLYREEGLAVRTKRRGKRAVGVARVPLALPATVNQVWTLDYIQDALASGRKFRTRNLMDGYTREAVAIETDTSLPGARVVRQARNHEAAHGLA
jgi:putative transposase